MILIAILLPLLFAAAAALYCAWELPRRRLEPEPEGCPAEECAAGSLIWKGLELDKRALRLAGLLCLPLGGGLYLLGLFYYGDTVEYALKLLFCFDIVAAAAVIDGHSRVIPNRLVLAGLAGSLCFLLAEILMGFTAAALIRDALLGLVLGGGVFLVCSLITRGGIGMGDVKLFGVLGLLLGWTGVFDLIFFSVLFVAGYGIVLLLRRRLKRSSQVPIGPFALAGMAAILLLGV